MSWRPRPFGGTGHPRRRWRAFAAGVARAVSGSQEAHVADLQRKAGNAAVARALSDGAADVPPVGTLGHLQRAVQREATAAVSEQAGDEESAEKAAAEAMADDAYVDKRIEKVEFLGGEQAVVHYADGAQFTLGLVPERATPPVEGVDYRSTIHTLLSAARRGRLSNGPRGQETGGEVPEPTTGDEFHVAYPRDVVFARDPASDRIVPTQVNSLTAPTLCTLLRKAEAEYEANITSIRRGAVRTLHVNRIALVVTSVVPGAAGVAARGAAAAAGTAGGATDAGPTPAGGGGSVGGATDAGPTPAGGGGDARDLPDVGPTPAEGAGTVGGGAGAAARAESAFADLFRDVLSGAGPGGAEITIGGVAVSDVKLTTDGGGLLATYSHIVDPARNPAVVKAVHEAFEQAAVAAARDAGLGTARVAVETVQNPEWAAFLESIGYAPRMVERGTTSHRLWLKVFKL